MSEYRRLEKIDSGGFGTVYKVVRTEDGEEFASKVLNLPASEEAVRRFRREVRIQAQLKHKNIVTIVGFDLESEQPSFIMPLAKSNLRREIPFIKSSIPRITEIFNQILEGIDHAHKNGIIHRDLKPENVLFYRGLVEDVVKISDFGLGRLVDRDTTTVTIAGEPLGTLAYSAPEQFVDAKRADLRADIYALGKILYEMITGEMPFPEMNLNKVPGVFSFIIQKCTDSDPDKRYQLVSELRDDLRLFTEEKALLESPLRRGRDFLAEMLGDSEIRAEQLQALTRLFLENKEDVQLYTELLPRIPTHIVEALIKSLEPQFKEIVRRYDSFVAGPLPFEYTDKVADFYEFIFERILDLSFRKMILRRLLGMGHRHNRWHVRDVFCRLIGSLKADGEVAVARDILKENQEAAEWCKEKLATFSIAPIIRQVLS